jgi:hypothetical protein
MIEDITNKKRICARCKVELKGGFNIKKYWIMPICYQCRLIIMTKDKARLFDLTQKERKITLKRLTKI